MHYEVTATNAATAHLEAGDHLAYDGNFLRSNNPGSPFPPFRLREALFPRLLTGHLFFSKRDAWEGEKIDLSGPLATNKFHPISVPAGKAYWVKLPYLVAFFFSPGARFTTTRKWLDPVAWLTGVTKSVIIHGPAELLFYGEGLATSDKSSIHSDLVVAFDAGEIFISVKSLESQRAG